MVGMSPSTRTQHTIIEINTSNVFRLFTFWKTFFQQYTMVVTVYLTYLSVYLTYLRVYLTFLLVYISYLRVYLSYLRVYLTYLCIVNVCPADVTLAAAFLENYRVECISTLYIYIYIYSRLLLSGCSEDAWPATTFSLWWGTTNTKWFATQASLTKRTFLALWPQLHNRKRSDDIF